MNVFSLYKLKEVGGRSIYSTYNFRGLDFAQ